MRLKFRILFFMLLGMASCKQEPIPKPKAQLKLEYPDAGYSSFSDDCPFEFLLNKSTIIERQQACGIKLDYPNMKAAIYLTYKPVENNLRELLLDAEKLTYEHVVKANTIKPSEYQNTKEKVYGMFYEVGGNAASQSQFYVTDSTDNFLTGSLYFYAKPNYDSVYPAAVYLQKDIRVLMESIRWKKED